MNAAARLALVIFVLVVLLAAGAWYYLFGPNKVDSAALVPGDTLLFASIPNGSRLALDYQGSRLKQLADSPNAQPIFAYARDLLGSKNLDLLQALAPNLSGQSFIAVTRFKPGNPPDIGVVAALRPKSGTDHFDDFIAKINALYPDFAGQGHTGTGQVEGLDYRWLQPPGATGSDQKICVARYRGWIVIAWGEDALRDWLERIRKKAATPSLAQNSDYMKSVRRTGPDAETFLYVDAHALGLLRPNLAHGGLSGSFAIGTRFTGGEIADSSSLLLPRASQAALGLGTSPCPFETLGFTGPDTCFYWGGSLDWPQIWKNLQALEAEQPPSHPALATFAAGLQAWAQAHHLDPERDIFGNLGGEASVQVEWPNDSSYPDVAFFMKLGNPDAFQPVEAAIVDTVRQAYSTRAVINELESNGEKFATLKFITPLPFSPTMTETGPYFALFTDETHAVRAFHRDKSIGLLNNGAFNGQIGSRLPRASQVFFLDSPRVTQHAYQAAMPYLSLASMFSPGLAGRLKDLPPDVQWLAPMGTWSASLSSDEEGLNGYSISGIGNQGFLAGGFLRFAFQLLPALPFQNILAPMVPSTPAPLPAVVPAPPAAVGAATNGSSSMPLPPSTNMAPIPPSPSSTSDATNAPAVPAPATNR